jgi:[acyl-carrier-protein] S-malonyltransferase
MLAQLRDEAPVGSTFEEADDVLGFDLGQIVAQGPEERLNQTEVTQPALLTASVALWRLWRHRGGPEPTLLSGHSLGEYSALVCGEGLTFGDAVALVHQRGKLMQAAVPAGEGAMAAILGLDDDQVRSCCESVDDVVAAANFNAPGQVVIAGASAAVDAAIANCQDAGARRAMKLAVSVPSHCQLMEQAATEFADKLKAVNLEKPRIPVIHNVDANVADSADGVKSALIAQLSNPVLWSTSVTEMAAHGVTNAVECGPGKVLAGLIKRIDRSLTVAAIDNPEALSAALESAAQ